VVVADDIRKTVDGLVTDVNSLKAGHVALASDVALLRQGQQEYQRYILDYVKRSDDGREEQKIHLDKQDQKLDLLILESAEWKGARKLFSAAWAVVLGVSALLGTVIAWLTMHAKAFANHD
jgi:hypothetical protein